MVSISVDDDEQSRSKSRSLALESRSISWSFYALPNPNQKHKRSAVVSRILGNFSSQSLRERLISSGQDCSSKKEFDALLISISKMLTVLNFLFLLSVLFIIRDCPAAVLLCPQTNWCKQLKKNRNFKACALKQKSKREIERRWQGERANRNVRSY